MSHQPLTDAELDAMEDISPRDFKNLRESYRALRRTYSGMLQPSALDDLRTALRAAEAIRDDARAHSQRALEEKREAEATHKTARERWERMLAAQRLGTDEMRRKMEAEIASLRSKLAARAVDAERRTRSDRSALLRMAGNIAGGLVVPYTIGDLIPTGTVVEAVVEAAVTIARAIMAEVDKP
jgi:hypothetical protein